VGIPHGHEKIEVRAKDVVVFRKQIRPKSRGLPQRPKKLSLTYSAPCSVLRKLGNMMGFLLSLSLSTTVVLSLTIKVEKTA